MKDLRIKYSSEQTSANDQRRSDSDRQEKRSKCHSKAPVFPDLPDNIVDEMLAALREEENAAHE